MNIKRVILFFLVFINHSLFAQSVKPAFYNLNERVLQNNKAKIASKDASLMPAYKQLLKDADKALSFGPVSVMEKKNNPPSGNKHDYMSLAPYFWYDSTKPNGLPYMRKDGQTNPEVKDYMDKDNFPKLCESIYTLALAYYFSNDKRYADHAAKITKVWFLDTATKMNPNMNFSQAIKGMNDGRGAGLIDARHLIKVVDGMGILSSSNAFTKNEIAGMKNWFKDFLLWMQTSKNGKDEMNAKNNHGVWYETQRLTYALFTDNKELTKKVIQNVETRIDNQIDNDGNFPAEMVRTTSLHYTVFVMEPLFKIANLSKSNGADLWSYTSPSGKSLKKAMDNLQPYLSGEKKWTGAQIKEFDFEEAIPILESASVHLNCTNCKETIKKIAKDKANRLRINLTTDIEL